MCGRGLSSGSTSTGNGKPDLLDRAKLEVAVLERDRPRRAFRRIVGAALDAMLPGEPAAEEDVSTSPTSEKGGPATPAKDVNLPPNDDKA